MYLTCEAEAETRLQATLVMVGPENPSELQGWLEKKKVEEGDFAKCLDRRPWTAKLPMIKDGIQLHCSYFGIYLH